MMSGKFFSELCEKAHASEGVGERNGAFKKGAEWAAKWIDHQGHRAYSHKRVEGVVYTAYLIETSKLYHYLRWPEEVPELLEDFESDLEDRDFWIRIKGVGRTVEQYEKFQAKCFDID